jgi:dinuclear metal center YbgI/SA1388 family protein
MTREGILAVLRALAPEETALPNDPVGLLIGADPETPITKIGVCLDATPDTVQRAVSCGVQLLIAHHPLIYHPLKRIDPAADPISLSVSRLVQAGIALYAMHTNWDRAVGGINDTLAATLELTDVRPLGTDGPAALPRLGDLACPRPLVDFARFVEKALNCMGASALRCHACLPETMISRVAVCGGAGAFLASEVQAAGAQAYVTSDVRHHEFLDAAARGFPLLDAGHGATETPGMRALGHLLTAQLKGVEIVWVGDD